MAMPSTPGVADRLLNVSCRATAGSGARTVIAGFVIGGTTPKDVLVRAIGPSLVPYGVTTALPNPRLRLFRNGTPLLDNDDWSLGGSTEQIRALALRLGAFPLLELSKDAALLTRLEPGAYTAHVTSDADATGVSLIEVYDGSEHGPNVPRVINLSTRGVVSTGEDILIVGFVVGGTSPRKVLVRGIGPTLGTYGVEGFLADPVLRVHDSKGAFLHENDNWNASGDGARIAAAAASVGGFALPETSKDAALLIYLAPGAYTAQMSGAGATSGIGLIEIYELP
jgi:hypothetical protein